MHRGAIREKQQQKVQEIDQETERVYHMLVEKGLHQVKVVGRLAVQEQPDKHVSARPGCSDNKCRARSACLRAWYRSAETLYCPCSRPR